jgi:hypothetical protein
LPIHYPIPQRRTATCPERGSARGKSGLRNSERLSPSQTCPRQSVPQKGKPHCQSVPPGKEKPSVRRPTLYNIWYNFLIIFINNTITCIL